MIRRFLCRVFGHVWADPRRIDDGRGEYVYFTFCRTCPTSVEGNWDAIEEAGAWKHYRSL